MNSSNILFNYKYFPEIKIIFLGIFFFLARSVNFRKLLNFIIEEKGNVEKTYQGVIIKNWADGLIRKICQIKIRFYKIFNRHQIFSHVLLFPTISIFVFFITFL